MILIGECSFYYNMILASATKQPSPSFLTINGLTSSSLILFIRPRKSWGKIKDDAEAATVVGDVTITFPLMMIRVLEKLKQKGMLKDE